MSDKVNSGLSGREELKNYMLKIGFFAKSFPHRLGEGGSVADG